MQFYFIAMLLVAWMLTWFDFDEYFIRGFNEITSKNISIAGYYFIFFVVGVLIDLIYMLRSKL